MARVSYKKQEFKVIIERDEDGFFVASVPALPGCHTQGRTFQELMKNIKDVIKLCLDFAKENAGYRKQIAEFGYEPSMIGVETVRI